MATPGSAPFSAASDLEAEPVLDWFHIATRWQHVHQLATGAIQQGQTAEARSSLLDRIERAKWTLWNGQLAKTLGHLSDVRVWTCNARADSPPNYGARYRAGRRFRPPSPNPP